MLGIYQLMDSDLRLYHQQNSGPSNYDSNGNIINENDYPLVSIIFGRCLVIHMSYTITIYNVLCLYISYEF